MGPMHSRLVAEYVDLCPKGQTTDAGIFNKGVAVSQRDFLGDQLIYPCQFDELLFRIMRKEFSRFVTISRSVIVGTLVIMLVSFRKGQQRR